MEHILEENKIMNINVGIMGHVDSGKTTLVKALSTHLSTASLDKNPQSKKRGITLDLGFSSFISNLPDFEQYKNCGFDAIQYTLVDCPGHASLIKTIIGGSQIIDIVIVVVDVLKGIQTQTAECIIISEITTKQAIFVLNKVDMIPEKDRKRVIDEQTTMLKKVLSKTRFNKAPILPISAQVGGGGLDVNSDSLGIKDVVYCLNQTIQIPHRDPNGSFLCSVDHCFNIKGKGCVMTGTVLHGSIKVGDDICIGSSHEIRKVKSIQIFHKDVNECKQGDRCGICIQNFDANTFERGYIYNNNYVYKSDYIIGRVKKVRFYKNDILTDHKLSISIGHETVMGTCTYFIDRNHIDEVNKEECGSDYFNEKEFNYNQHYQYLKQLNFNSKEEVISGTIYVLIRFPSPILIYDHALFMGSNLNGSNDSNCRIAMYGSILNTNIPLNLNALMIYKPKQKKAIIDRKVDNYTYIARDLLEKGADITPFIGMIVKTESGELGKIESSFGKSGKFKVYFNNPVELSPNNSIFVEFKRYLFDEKNTMQQ